MPARKKATKVTKGSTATPMPTPPGTFLVLGYGNVLRSDDGLGPRVAEAIAALQLPNVRALACHQLTPELSEPVSQAQAVIFVDAAAAKELSQVTVNAVLPDKGERFAPHRSSPGTLLALAESLYGHCPPAWLVGVPAFTLDFGEELSPQAVPRLQEAVSAVQRLIQLARIARPRC